MFSTVVPESWLLSHQFDWLRISSVILLIDSSVYYVGLFPPICSIGCLQMIISWDQVHARVSADVDYPPPKGVIGQVLASVVGIHFQFRGPLCVLQMKLTQTPTQESCSKWLHRTETEESADASEWLATICCGRSLAPLSSISCRSTLPVSTPLSAQPHPALPRSPSSHNLAAGVPLSNQIHCDWFLPLAAEPRDGRGRCLAHVHIDLVLDSSKLLPAAELVRSSARIFTSGPYLQICHPHCPSLLHLLIPLLSCFCFLYFLRSSSISLPLTLLPLPDLTSLLPSPLFSMTLCPSLPLSTPACAHSPPIIPLTSLLSSFSSLHLLNFCSLCTLYSPLFTIWFHASLTNIADKCWIICPAFCLPLCFAGF